VLQPQTPALTCGVAHPGCATLQRLERVQLTSPEFEHVQKVIEHVPVLTGGWHPVDEAAAHGRCLSSRHPQACDSLLVGSVVERVVLAAEGARIVRLVIDDPDAG